MGKRRKEWQVLYRTSLEAVVAEKQGHQTLYAQKLGNLLPYQQIRYNTSSLLMQPPLVRSGSIPTTEEARTVLLSAGPITLTTGN